MAAHAKLSASGAHRWLGTFVPPANGGDGAWLDPANWHGCPASIAAEAEVPDTGSSYAAEGTAAHYVVEQCLTHDDDAETHKGRSVRVHAADGATGWACDFDGLPGDGETDFEVTTKMADACQQFIDAVRMRGGDQRYEVRVDYSAYVPGGFGTADGLSFVETEHTLYVDDFKYGKGVRVDAEHNPQGLFYAVGSYLDNELVNDVRDVVIAIHQPRLDHVSEWRVLRDDLMQWARDVAAPKAEAALDADAEYNPSEDACKFCNAKAVCRARAARLSDAVTDGFDIVEVPADLDVNLVSRDGGPVLTNAELAAILPRVKQLKAWASDVEDFAKAELEAGRPVPGYKLVEGRGSRQWVDPEKAEAALKRKVGADKAVKREVISVAQAEKLLGKGDRLLTKYAERLSGKPTLAPVSDERPSILETTTDGFDTVEADLDF